MSVRRGHRLKPFYVDCCQAVHKSHDRIEVGDLPPKVTRARALKPVAAQPTALVPLADVERRHILGVLEAVDGHRGKAAEVLQIDRKTLYRKLLSYGVEA